MSVVTTRLGRASSACLSGPQPSVPGRAPRQPGSLLASSWRPRGRCPVAPARSEAEAAANAHSVVGDVSQDVVEIPTGLTPRAQVLQPLRLITASPVIPIGFPPLVVRSVQHTVGRSARQTVITARPASAGAGNRTAEERRNNEPVLRRYSAVATSTGPPQETNPTPPGPPHPLASGQVVRSAQCGPLALIVDGTRRRRRASKTVRSGRSGQINSAGTNAQRGRPESGHISGTLPRVQPRLARCPPRALTRWCVARGEGAARCAGRPCRSAARQAVSPVRAAPDTPRAGPRRRAVPAR